tara:strand:- start:586 stop:1161 length:576 start_codon:yes stop_codon:yes gene_type:complete
MKVENLKSNYNKTISDVFLITPQIYLDSRGFFMESWNQRKFNHAVGKEITFKQDNHSKSSKGVLRGLHFQCNPLAQGKLVRCIKGEIYDVAVDIRRESKTFLEWVGVLLNSQNHNQLWIPEGFAHGFLTLSHSAEVLYKTTEYWSQKHEKTLIWNDPKLSIDWLKKINEPKLSPKDLKGEMISNIDEEIFF